jgi:predicted dehydrogenase
MNNKRIGFIDLNLENFHANVFLNALRHELKDRGFSVSGCFGQRETESRQWAEKNQVPYFDTVKALGKVVDFLMVLAPSNPEAHLELCRMAFRLKKPTYVDKTFAPDLKTAKRIFALADRQGVITQTTSALRYTSVQAFVREVGAANVRHLVTWGGGGSFGEYAIHPLEMAVSCLGPQAERMTCRGEGDQRQLLIDFSGGRTAVVNVYAKTRTDFMASVTTDKETKFINVDGARLFVDTAAAILGFFEDGKANIDRAESLMIRRILDVAGKPEIFKRWIKL